MAREFVITELFDRLWDNMGLDDDNLQELQSILNVNPHKGEIINGTGGARKIREALSHKGKSGGIRVIYLDITHKQIIFLLYCYPKSKQDDLTPEQKKQVRKIVEAVKGAYR